MIGGLTKTETTALLSGLVRRNKLTRENYEAVTGWGENAKLDSDLLVLVFLKYVELDVDREGVLQFIPTEKGLASERRSELERLAV